MNVHRLALLGLACLRFAQSGVAALDVDVDAADMRRATAIALSSEASRARFHEAYNVPIDDSAIERIEVITEFRRFAMEAERQNALGNWMMARGGYDSQGRTLQALLKESRGQLTIRVQIRLHPLHTYTAVPPYDVALGNPPLLPVTVTRTPITRPPENGGGLAGVIVETAFNAPSVGDATLPVLVLLGGKEIAHARVDFARLE